MQALARTCGRSAADSMIQKCRLKSIYFNHPSEGNSTNYYIILGLRDKAAPPASRQIGQFPPKRVKYRHCHPFFLFLSSSSTGELSLLSTNQRQGSSNWANNYSQNRFERSFLDPEYSFVAVRRIPRTRFAKQKFAQLRMNYVR